jgi:hypothetical protein
MFDRKETSTEIALAMEKKLLANAKEEVEQPIEKFARAVEYLNTVAEMFDDLGLEKEAEYTTTLLEVVAGKKKKKKLSKSKTKSKSSKKSDPAVKGLTPEKMVDNLKHKGWVFNADDNSVEDKHSHGCMCSMCMDVNDIRHGEDCVCSYCMDADDGNDHYDTSEDASYDVKHDDNYADIFGDDFEDEIDLKDARHHVMRPPPSDRHHDVHPKQHIDTSGFSNWDYVNDPAGVPFADEKWRRHSK